MCGTAGGALSPPEGQKKYTYDQGDMAGYTKKYTPASSYVGQQEAQYGGGETIIQSPGYFTYTPIPGYQAPDTGSSQPVAPTLPNADVDGNRGTSTTDDTVPRNPPAGIDPVPNDGPTLEPPTVPSAPVTGGPSGPGASAALNPRSLVQQHLNADSRYDRQTSGSGTKSGSGRNLLEELEGLKGLFYK